MLARTHLSCVRFHFAIYLFTRIYRVIKYSILDFYLWRPRNREHSPRFFHRRMWALFVIHFCFLSATCRARGEAEPPFLIKRPTTHDFPRSLFSLAPRLYARLLLFPRRFFCVFLDVSIRRASCVAVNSEVEFSRTEKQLKENFQDS